MYMLKMNPQQSASERQYMYCNSTRWYTGLHTNVAHVVQLA